MQRTATEFVKAAPSHDRPDELIDALQPVAAKAKLQVIGAIYIPPRSMLFDRQRIDRSLFFHADFPGSAFWSDYQPVAIAKGGSPCCDYARQHSTPFTVTDVMRAMQLTGGQRWEMDIFRPHRMREVLYCPQRRWLVTFYSERTVQLDQFERQLFAWTVGAAVAQMERLVKRPLTPSERPELTPRELSALQRRARGYSNQDGAAEMGISINTFRGYIERAIAKLGANDLANAVHIAHTHGLLPGGCLSDEPIE